jgi:hypothetical protein
LLLPAQLLQQCQRQPAWDPPQLAILAVLLLLLLLVLVLLLRLPPHLHCYSTSLPLLLLVWASQAASAAALLLLRSPCCFLHLPLLKMLHRLLLLLLLPRVRLLLPAAKPATRAPSAACHPSAAPTRAGQS